MEIKSPEMKNPPNPEVIALLTRFGIASNLFQSVMDKRLARVDLTLAQLSVLSHLVRAGSPRRVTDIARAVEVSQPAVTKILAKFEGLGLITFSGDKRDKRIKAAEATPAGAQHFIEVQRRTFPEMGAFLNGWSSQDRTQFTDYLMRLGAFLDQTRSEDDAAASTGAQSASKEQS